MANETKKGKSLLGLNFGPDGVVSFEDNFRKAVQEKMDEAREERERQATGEQPDDDFYSPTYGANGANGANGNNKLTPEWQREQATDAAAEHAGNAAGTVADLPYEKVEDNTRRKPEFIVPEKPAEERSYIDRTSTDERLNQMVPWREADDKTKVMVGRILEHDRDKDAERLSGSVADMAINVADRQATKAWAEGYARMKLAEDAMMLGPAYAKGAAGFGIGVETSNNYWKQLTPEAVGNHVEAALKQIPHEEVFDAAYKAGVRTDWYIANVLAPKIQQDIYNNLLERQVPKDTLEYVASGVFNSIIGQVAETLYMPTEVRQMRAQGRQIAKQREDSFLADAANMGVGFAADAPIFKGLGQVVSLLKYGGANKAIGLALDYSRGGLNFAGYNAISTMTGAAHQKGEITGGDVLKAVEEAGKGFVMGTAMGITGSKVQKSIAGWSQNNGIGIGVMLGTRAAQLANNTAVMATADMLMNPDTDILSGKDWLEQGKNALMMNVVMDTMHAVEGIAKKPAVPYKERGIDIQAMKNAGIPVRSEKELYRWLTQPGQSRSRLVEDILKNNKLSVEDKNEVYKLVSGDTNDAVRLNPTMDAAIKRTIDGQWVVQETDALGTINKRKTFASREEAEAYQESLQADIMRNNTEYVEAMDNARNEAIAMKEAIDVVAKQTGMDAMKIRQIILKNGEGGELTAEEQAVRDEVFSYRDTYKEYATTTREEALEAVELANGMEAGTLEGVLAKDYRSLTDAERKAVQDYNDIMSERLSGKGEAEGVTGAREDLFTPEQRQQSQEKGMGLYINGNYDAMRAQRLRVEQAAERVNGVFGDGFANELEKNGLLAVERMNEQGIELSEAQEALITDYLMERQALDTMLEQMDAAHKVEIDVARTAVKDMSPQTDEDGNTIIRIAGIDGKVYVVRNQVGDSMMLTPVELREDGTIDWNSYDAKNVQARNWKPGVRYQDVLGSEVMKERIPEYMQEYNAIFGERAPEAGMEIMMPAEGGKMERVKLMGQDAMGNWVASGTMGEYTLTDADVRRMVAEQEKAAVEVEKYNERKQQIDAIRKELDAEKPAGEGTGTVGEPAGDAAGAMAGTTWSRDGYKIDEEGKEVRAGVQETADKMVEDAEGDAGIALQAVRNKQTKLRVEMDKIRKEHESETETVKLLEQKKQYEALNDELEHWNRVEAYYTYKVEAEKQAPLITRERAELMQKFADKIGSKLNISTNMYGTMLRLYWQTGDRQYLPKDREDANLVNGINANGVIYVNGESIRGLLWTFGHESGHSVAAVSKEAYTAFKDAVRTTMGAKAWEEAKKAKRKVDVYGKVSEEAIEEEVVNDQIGEIFNAPNKFDTFAKLLVDGRAKTGLKALLDATKKFANNMSLEGLKDVTADLKKEWETVTYNFEGAEKKLAEAYGILEKPAGGTSGKTALEARRSVRYSIEPDEALEIGKGAEWRWKELRKGQLNDRNIAQFLYGMSTKFPKLMHWNINPVSSKNAAASRVKEIEQNHAYRDQLVDMYSSDVTTPKAKQLIKSKIIDYDYALNFYQKWADGELSGMDYWVNDMPRFSKEEKPAADATGTVAPIFYSNAQRAVEGIRQEKATPEQWLAMITKLGGIKAGEDKWMGLSEWLKNQDKKSLTREDVLKYIQENQIQVEEQHYEEMPVLENNPILQAYRQEFNAIAEELSAEREKAYKNSEEFEEKMYEKYGYDWFTKITDEENKTWNELVNKFNSIDNTDAGVFDEMVNRHGDDFRMAFHVEGGELEPEIDYPYGVNDAARTLLNIPEKQINETRLQYTTEGLENKKEIALTAPTIESWNESDEIHFGDAGGGRAVAWVRFGETTDTDGNRVNVIDEVHSKRGQRGREMGFVSERANSAKGQYEAAERAMHEYRNKMKEKYGEYFLSDDLTAEENAEYKRLLDDMRTKSNYRDDKTYNVPDMPFEKNWHELAMKRMLRYAAENGYDKLAWTTGAQQAERYNIGTAVRSIHAGIDQNGNRVMLIYPKYGKTIDITYDNEGNITHINEAAAGLFEQAENIRDIVGKEIAEQALSITGKGTENMKTWKGDGLHIGGEGMAGFYDRILPSFMNKYGKKWGVKVGEVELPNLEKSAQKMWAVDITPEMKESVLMEGQPMFSKEGEIGQRRLVEAGLDEDNLEIAKAMRDAGKLALTIKMATGWEYGRDGKWKKEDEDLHFQDGVFEKYQPLVLDDKSWIFKKLPEVMGDSRLFTAYPMLKDIILNVKVNWPAGLRGAYDDDYGWLSLNKRLFEGKPEVAKRNIEEVIGHEVQHIIQEQEGFARGGNPDILTRRVLEDNMTPEEKEAHRNAIKKQAQSADTLESLREQGESLKEMSFDKSGYKTIQEFLDTKEAKWQPAVKMMKELEAEYNATKEAFNNSQKEAFNIREKVAKRLGLENKMFLGVDGYHRLAGEVEARAVGNRVNMTPENRRRILTIVDEDVPAAEQILRFSKETDPETLKKLENEETVKVYRAIRVNEDGTLSSPMAGGGVGGKKKAERTDTYQPKLGEWEKADEHPELAAMKDGDEYAHVTIDKGEGNGTLEVAYNPYIHTSRQMLNDQFSSAWRRPNLQVMEVEVPVSELTSGYRADMAKNTVGETEWTDGVVARQLEGDKKRKVILSRWDKPVRIVPVEEYAKAVKEQLDGGNVEGIPFNCVTPEQREALVKEGIKILEPEKKAGAEAMKAYKEWAKNANVNVNDNYTNTVAYSKEDEKVFEAAAKKFGVTNDIREAGYVLPDGRMLDFSGRHELNAGQDSSFLKGRRATDHRAIGSISYIYDKEGNEVDTGIETDMPKFIRSGAIRIDDNAGYINLAVKPTSEQKEAIRRLVARNDGDVQVEFGDGWDSDHYVEYDGAKPAKVLADIDRYFNEGIKPESDVKFSKEDEFAEKYSLGNTELKDKIAIRTKQINDIRKNFGEEYKLSDEDLVNLRSKIKKPLDKFYSLAGENIADAYVQNKFESGSNVIDPDELRSIAFEVVGYDGTNVSLYGKNDDLVQKVYKKSLAKVANSNNPTLILLTGHAGAGKSTAVNNSAIDTSKAGLVYDSAFNTSASLLKAIETAKEAGIKEDDIRIVAVYNDLETSFKNTIERTRENGRTVPVGYFVEHAFKKNAGKLNDVLEKYPNLKITCLDNSGNKGSGEVALEEGLNWNYNVSESDYINILKILENEINKEQGGLTESQTASITRGLSGLETTLASEWVERLANRIASKVSRNARQGRSGEVGRVLASTQPKDKENFLDYAQRVMAEERSGVDTNPTEAQKEAGNYKKGHIRLDGYNITIENPKGSTRSGKDADGKEWSVKMNYDYGYIRGTKGVDGDHIDVYLGPDQENGHVFVVDQIDQRTGEFDEHKVMYGFPDAEAATEAYKSQYEDGWKVGTVTEVTKEEFKKWVDSSTRKTKPFSEYVSVHTEGDVRLNDAAENSDEINVRYMYAIKNGDTEKAKELFDEWLREQIGNGVVPYLAAGKYFINRNKAHSIKNRDPKVVAELADKMAGMIPKDAVLVPAPSHTGEATDMLDLANALSERTGVPVADVLKSKQRDSQYASKRAGKAMTADELGITVQGELPEGKLPIVIDNVVDSGNTAAACIKALGKGVVVSFTDSVERGKHVAELKSAEPITYDNNGNVIPLSERFNLNKKDVRYSKEGRSAEWKKAKEELKDYPFALETLRSLEDQDINDVAASVLAGGGLLWGDKGEGPNRKKGVQSMMGWKEGERKNFLSMFAKDGMTFAQAGEAVEQACREEHIPFDENDPNAGVNALQEVLGSVKSMGELTNYVELKRVDEARTAVQDAQNHQAEERNQYYLRNYGMSYEEYLEMQDESAKAQAGNGVSEEAQRDINWLKRRNERQADELQRLQKELERLHNEELARPLVITQGKIIEQQKAQLDQTKTELNQLKDATKRKKNYEDAYRQLLDVKRDVANFVREQLAAEDMPFTSKKDLNKLLATIEKTNTVEQLQDALREVQIVAGRGRVKHLDYELSKLLRLQIQGLNGKRMSVAKTVDDRTRRIIEDIRGRVQDIGISGMEEELDGLMRARREQRGAINELRTKLKDANAEEKVTLQAKIDEGEKRWQELSKQIQAKADEISEARESKRSKSVEDLTDEINAIIEQADKLAEEGKQLPDAEADKLTALEGFKILQQSKKSANDVYKLEKAIRDLWTEVYDLRAEREGKDENERKRLNKLIINRKEKIKANEALLVDAINQQAFDIQEGINMLETLMDEGRNSLKQWADARLLRRCEMIRNACNDVRNKKNGVDFNRGSNPDIKKNPTWKSFVNAPVGSFEYMAQRLGQTGKAGKDSWIYQHFVMGKDGVMEAFNTYQRGLREQKDQLNEKVTEIFGTENSKVLHTDAWVRQAEKADKIVYDSGVTIVREDGKREVLPLSKGAATYLYMVWKMNDGKSKMMLQGFDEVSMKEIQDFIGKDYMQLANWLQDTFLVGTRAKYNERYRELYNTSMARIENYVPLRVNKDATRQESDLSEDKNRRQTLEQRAGSLITRTVNNLPVDITKSVFDVISEHVEQMENWYAYSPVRRDLDAILSNTFFRNQVDANNAGHFKRFYDAAAIATQSYVAPPAEHGDALMGMMTKGLLGGNIAWRAATAIKQLYSASAYLGYTYDPRFLPYLMKNTATAVLGVNFQWCMDNIPSFRARVDMGDIGNVRISERVGDLSGNWAKKLNKYLQNYTAVGMIPNRLIDALTCSIGAKSIYDYKIRQLRLEIEKDKTLTNEQRQEALKEAHRKAVMEADIFYNSTQQSSNPMFLSPMQVSRTLIDRSLTAYQNNNLGYVRKTLEAAYDLIQSAQYQKMKKAYKDSYIEDGIAEYEADTMARRQVLKTIGNGLLGVFVMAWLNKYLWDKGSTGFFGFWADPIADANEQQENESDDDYKNRMEWDSFYEWIGLPARPLQGTPMGNYLKSASEKRSWNPLLVFNELDDLKKDFDYIMENDGVFSKELLWAVINHGMRTEGINLETLGNIYYGLEQMAIDGGDINEKMIDLMFALNNPNKGRVDAAKNLYKDEDFITYAQDVAKADKYLTKGTALAHYFPWMKEFNGEGANSKQLKREYDKLKKEWEAYHDIDFSKPAGVGAETTKIYNEQVKWDDIVEDGTIANLLRETEGINREWNRLKKEDKESEYPSSAADDYLETNGKQIAQYKLINKYKKKFGALKRKLNGTTQDETIMDDIRELRSKFLKEIKDEKFLQNYVEEELE